MRTPSKFFLVILLLTLFAGLAWGQRRDPLTDKESDDLREFAQEPLKRMKLLVKYATERLDTVDRVQNEPKAADRGKRMHDALEDFRSIVDELDDNIDDYNRKSSDLRKALTEIVTAETAFQERLEGIKRVAEEPKNADIYKLFSFALQDAIEAVSLSLEDAKRTLEEQNAALSTKKK